MIFRRLGYSEVVLLRSTGADGGIDIKMRRGDKRCIVQCRHYPPSEYVSVDAVRATAFVAIRDRADEVIFITTGRFSPPCYVTASDSPIPMTLIDGAACWDLVQESRRAERGGQTPSFQPTTAGVEGDAIRKGSIAEFDCPTCGSEVVRRLDRKRQLGFWGCTKFPKCRWSAYDPPAPSEEAPRCLLCGAGVSLKSGKYGRFWGCNLFPGCRGTRLYRDPAAPPVIQQPQRAPTPLPPISPDGHWMWNGTQWESTLSPDGRFRWSGREWIVLDRETRS